MPDSDESCRIIRPASHTSALGLVFIAENGAGAQGGICGDESTWRKARESNLHGASGAHRKGAGRAPRVRMPSILQAATGAAAMQAFSLSLGLDLKMRRIGLNQVEREWIVIRCVKTFVYLPAVYLNRAAHERPVYLSVRRGDAVGWWGLASQLGRRGNQPVPMSWPHRVSRRPSSSRQPQRACTADRNMLNQTEPRPAAKRATHHSNGFPDEGCMSPASILRR
jgi:hypothetical protein